MAKRKKPSVNVPSPSLKEKLTFSFEFYDKNSDEFCLSCWSQQQIRDAILRLQDISTKTFNELYTQRGIYHFNEVVWERTIKPEGFPHTALRNLPPFHFALLGINNQRARVFGAYAAGVFYIVWFDLNHTIWPSVLRNT